MASFSQFYSDYEFPVDYSSHFPDPLTGLETYCSTSTPETAVLSNCSTVFDDCYGTSNMLPAETTMCSADVSPALATFFPERFGISDLAVSAAILPDTASKNIDVCGNVSGFQYHYGGHEFGEEWSPDFKPIMSPMPVGENSGIQEGKQIPLTEDTNVKVGKYSVEERKVRILRYLKKRNQRNFNKTIKYACRKNLADRRVRIRGRFARNNEPSEQETTPKKNNEIAKKEEEMCSGDDFFQIEQDDGWLQEAVSSLMYFPDESYGDDHTWSL